MGEPAQTVRALPQPGGPPGHDRVPPHNLDAEVSVLGAMLLSKDAIAEVSELVGPEDFYRGAHRTIYEAIHDLYDRGEPVDLVTLSDELEGRGDLEGVGGSVGVSDLLSRVPTAANALYYARIVAEHAMRRRLIDAGGTIARLGFDSSKDADEAVDGAEQLVYDVAQRKKGGEFTSMKQLLNQSFELIEKLHENNSPITGLETGFIDFDELTAGLQPSNLVILAARPAMGKCLAGSSRILDPTSGALLPIQELVDRAEGGLPCVLTLGADCRLWDTQASAVHDNGVQPVFRLRTRLGRELVATANHPLLTIDGWLPLGMLRPGWRIATPRAVPRFGGSIVPAAEVQRLATSTTTSVPEPIFRAPREQVATFLSRLFAGGGGVSIGKTSAQVTYTANSRRLADDVQHLLLRFGVIARIRERKRAADEGTDRCAWELQVTAPDAIRSFAREIGIFGKEERLHEALALLDRHGTSANSDLVPAEVWDRVTDGERPWRELSLATGRPDDHTWHGGQRAPAGRPLSEIAEHDGDPVLQNLSESDVYWDEIVTIEPAGEERVYDLTVPEHHNFVANDVIVHNSTLVTNLATHVAVELRKPAVLFSLEMSQMELVQRILAAQARVDSERLRTGRLQETDWPKLSQAMGRLAEAPLYIDDTAGINLMEIRSKARRLKQKQGLELIVVDYLQLMQSHRRVESRVQEVSELSRGLKILAKELNVPVLALSQLSRKPEDRTDRRPQLSDLRESGSIEQDADIVCFIYRDEVYDPESSAKGEAELIVAKHRNGPLRTIRLSFIGHHSRFANMARGPRGAPPPPPAGGPL